MSSYSIKKRFNHGGGGGGGGGGRGWAENPAFWPGFYRQNTWTCTLCVWTPKASPSDLVSSQAEHPKLKTYN